MGKAQDGAQDPTLVLERRSLGGDFLAFALRLMDARGTTSRQPWSKIAVCTSYRPDHEGFLHTYSCVRNASMLSSEWFPEQGVPTLASYRQDAHRAAISCHLYTRDIHGFSSSSISDFVISFVGEAEIEFDQSGSKRRGQR